MLSAFVNSVYGTRYSDLCYGFNVFWKRHVPVFGLVAEAPFHIIGDRPLWGDGFEIETLINIRVAVAGLTVTEVPSFEHSRIHGMSNLRTFSDGFRVLRTILAERRGARQRAVDAPSAALAGMSRSGRKEWKNGRKLAGGVPR